LFIASLIAFWVAVPGVLVAPAVRNTLVQLPLRPSMEGQRRAGAGHHRTARTVGGIVIDEGRMQPSEALRYFGQVARHFRDRARLTHAELGAKVGYVGALVGHVETARRIATDDYVLRLEEVLDAGGLLAAALPMLEEERRRAESRPVYVFVVEASAQRLPGAMAAKLLRRLARGASAAQDDRRADE
jgi:hypothetical protein